MGKQRVSIKAIYGAIAVTIALAIALWPTLSPAGVDPVQFFTQGSPKIVKKLGTKRGIDRFLALDQFGNALQLRTGDPLSMFAEIGGSLLSQGIELPSLPTYPTFVRLESDGFLQDKWTRATVQMQNAAPVSARSVSKLTPTQAGEWMGQMMVNQILGNQTVLSSPEYIAVAGQHVITPSLGQSFQGYANSAGDTLARYMDQIPQSRLSALSSKEAEEAISRLNVYLSRLEKMSSKDIEKLFGAYFDSTTHGADYRAEIKRRIQNARTELIQYFTKKYPQFRAKDHLSTLAHVDRPVFHLPAYKASRGVSPSQVIGTPEHRLWAHYFHEPSQLATTPVSEISNLMLEARDRHDIFYVGPTVDTDYFASELGDPPQTHLNPKNGKTLVVAPANDQEALEICRIARSSGAHVMRFNGDEYRHGVKLTEPLANEILKQAKKLGVETIAVVEMPGETREIEFAIAKQGYSLIPIDHHSDSHAARGESFSSLEQAAQLLGYDLGGKSKTIEVSDRSFVSGLFDLGLSKKAVSQLYPARVKEEVIQSFPRFKSSKTGDFIVIKDYVGNFPELIGSITQHEWPRKVNVLLVGPGPMLRFSGNPKFRSVLTEMFQPYDSQVRSNLFGGDAMRSQYWGLRGIPRDSVNPFTAMALNEVEAVLDPADAKKFKDILASRLHISKGIYNTIDSKMDRRRAGSGREISSPSKGCVYQVTKAGLSKM